MEIWADVFGDKRYFISNYGNLKNSKGYLIKLQNDKDGYKMYSFYLNGKKTTKKIHRLVAEKFVPNPYNYSCINHKDEDKTNNRFDNLEYCTVAYNNCYGSRIESRRKKISKPVICVELNIEFESATKAAKFVNRNKSCICACCNGKKQMKTSGGYHWKWKEKEKNEKI